MRLICKRVAGIVGGNDGILGIVKGIIKFGIVGGNDGIIGRGKNNDGIGKSRCKIGIIKL